jgi:hypothetical protein
MSDGNLSYIEHLQKCYNQLRRSRLVKQAPIVSDDSLQHFTRILNSALPRVGVAEEALLDKCIKTQYFWNQRGYIRGLHPARNNKNLRKDARCFVLLTIGLEIVREFELEKVVHLTWNKDTREYMVESLIDPNNPPDPETFRAEQREARAERMSGRRRTPAVTEPTATEPTATESAATESAVTEAAQVETPTEESPKAWGDSSAPQ